MTNISTRLENLQQLVGGYVQSVTIPGGCAILCNEDGKLTDLPYNCTVCGHEFVGDIILIGFDKDGFRDFPIPFKTLKTLCPALWSEDDE